MVNPDILRVMAELYTFTSEDLAEALDCPAGTTGGLLPQWVRAGYVVRFKFRKTYLYALSRRGERLAEKLPPVDPEERCLPVSFDGIEPEPGFYQRCCEVWDMGHIVYEEIEPGGMIGSWTCCGCGKRHPVAVFNQH